MTKDIPMFALSNYSPHWKGAMIAKLEEPLRRGLAQLRKQAEDQECLGFSFISEYCYDGLVTWIDAIEAYPGKVEANADLIRRLDEHERRILAENPNWHRAYDNVLPADILPATFNVIPQSFGTQYIGRGYKQPNPYNSIYVRMVRIDRENGDPVEQLLALDGQQGEVIRWLQKAGGLDERAWL